MSELGSQWLSGAVLHSGLELLDHLIAGILHNFTGEYQVIWSEDDWKQVKSGSYTFLFGYMNDAVSVSYEGMGRTDTIILYAGTYIHWTKKLQYTVSEHKPATALFHQAAVTRLVSILQHRVLAPVHPFPIPINCMAVVLSFIDPKDSQRLSMCSSSLHITLQSQSLWQLAYIFRFGDPMFSLQSVDWRSAYRNQASSVP